jgi:hypothetical protein
MGKEIMSAGERGPQLDAASLHYFTSRNWLGEGELSKWTDAVRDFTDHFKIGGAQGYDSIEALSREVWRFRKVMKSPEDIASTYARRTADEIISSGEVFVLGDDGEGRHPQNFPSVQACLERSLVIATALRCGGVPASFVRKGTHSTCRFQLGSNLYEVGQLPLPQTHFKLIVPLYPGEAEKVKTLKAEGIYREGLDPRDIGMNSILDYWICRGPGNERQLFEQTYPGLVRGL